MTQDASVGLKEVDGIMAEDFVKPVKGRRFIRAYWENGKFHLPNGLHSNGVLSSMAGCNCLIDTAKAAEKIQGELKAEDSVQGIMIS